MESRRPPGYGRGVSDETLDETTDETELSEEEMRERMAQRLDELRVEHRRLDAEIDAARETGVVDMLKLGRMKKIKLAMKDQIVWLENQLTPDIIA